MLTIKMRNKAKENFKNALNEEMDMKGIGSAELAKRTGFSRSTINNYVFGRSMPNAYRLDVLACALDCNYDEFLHKCLEGVDL